MFRLEAEAYEEERLAAMAHRAPTTDDHEAEPTTTTTTEARQEGPALADTHTTPDHQPASTTLPVPVPVDDAQREATAIPDSAAKPRSLIPPSEQPHQPHAPEDILGILEED